MISKAEQELNGERYWITDLIQGSVAFFLNNEQFGKEVQYPEFPSSPEDRAVCQHQEVSGEQQKPAFDLSLPPNRGVMLRFKRDPQGRLFNLYEEIQIAKSITNCLGLFDGQVHLTSLERITSLPTSQRLKRRKGPKENLGPVGDILNQQEFYLEFPASVSLSALRRLEKRALPVPRSSCRNAPAPSRCRPAPATRWRRPRPKA